MNDKEFWIYEASAENDVCDKSFKTSDFVAILQEQIDRSKAKSVLEIGCGYGRVLDELAKNNKDIKFTGIDISQSFLDLAPKRTNTRYLLTENINEKYDFIYSVLVFQHIPFKEKKTYIDKSYRALNYGGRFTFQYVEGTDKGRCNYQETFDNIKLLINDFKLISRYQHLMHPQWSWITLEK